MVENLFLRAAWTLNISVGEAGAKILNQDVISTILIILEIFRWVGSQCLFVCLFGLLFSFVCLCKHELFIDDFIYLLTF